MLLTDLENDNVDKIKHSAYHTDCNQVYRELVKVEPEPSKEIHHVTKNACAREFPATAQVDANPSRVGKQ